MSTTTTMDVRRRLEGATRVLAPVLLLAPGVTHSG